MKDVFQWHRRAQDAFGEAYQPRYDVSCYPSHLKGAKGCYVFDHAGKKYLDFTSAGGMNLLGAGNERLTAAVAPELGRGTALPVASHLEVETAEKLKELFPFVQAVRFFRSHAEAMGAAKAILHPRLSHVFDMGLGGTGDLDFRVKTSRQNGNRIIFDEGVTGLRYRRFSVTAALGVDPDLVVLGGALGGGMPLAAVGGPYATMLGAPYRAMPVDTVTLASAKQAMTLLQTRYSVDDLWLRGQDFLDRFNAIWPERVRLEGYAVHAQFAGDPKATQSFRAEAVKAGLLFGDEVLFSFPMIDEYQSALELCKDILVKMRVKKEFQ